VAHAQDAVSDARGMKILPRVHFLARADQLDRLARHGENMDALEDFHPSRIADRILGMGDIVSLVERAAENIDAEKAAAMARKMQSGKFDLNDLADQIRQMQNMGGMGGMMGLMPGMGKIKDQVAAAGLDDKLLKRQLAIIGSMTASERGNPDMLKHSRKKRIASGSGTTSADINKLLKMHRQMADVMKSMSKGKGGMMGQLMGGLGAKLGLGGGGGMGGMAGMPDLSKMDPKQLEAMAKMAQSGGLGGQMPGLPKGLPPGMGGGLPGLPGGGFPGLPGFPGKKK
ncbi:MAG: hypothetical protein H7Y08_11100, partial [Rhizobiaceae bacterium]|nr:hypothetical protein [Rhizobiaceae bacterium]